MLAVSGNGTQVTSFIVHCANEHTIAPPQHYYHVCNKNVRVCNVECKTTLWELYLCYGAHSRICSLGIWHYAKWLIQASAGYFWD